MALRVFPAVKAAVAAGGPDLKDKSPADVARRIADHMIANHSRLGDLLLPSAPASAASATSNAAAAAAAGLSDRAAAGSVGLKANFSGGGGGGSSSSSAGFVGTGVISDIQVENAG